MFTQTVPGRHPESDCERAAAELQASSLQKLDVAVPPKVNTPAPYGVRVGGDGGLPRGGARGCACRPRHGTPQLETRWVASEHQHCGHTKGYPAKGWFLEVPQAQQAGASGAGA